MNSSNSYSKGIRRAVKQGPWHPWYLPVISYEFSTTTTDLTSSSNTSSGTAQKGLEMSSFGPSEILEKHRQSAQSSMDNQGPSRMGLECSTDGNTMMLTLEFLVNGEKTSFSFSTPSRFLGTPPTTFVNHLPLDLLKLASSILERFMATLKTP